MLANAYSENYQTGLSVFVVGLWDDEYDGDIDYTVYFHFNKVRSLIITCNCNFAHSMCTPLHTCTLYANAHTLSHKVWSALNETSTLTEFAYGKFPETSVTLTNVDGFDMDLGTYVEMSSETTLTGVKVIIVWVFTGFAT